MLTYGIPPELHGGVHLFIKTAIRHGVSPEFIGSRNCVPMAFTAESPPAQASKKPHGSSKRVLPGQVTMDQLICASLSHTHCWYEVGILKAPASLYNLLKLGLFSRMAVGGALAKRWCNKAVLDIAQLYGAVYNNITILICG